MPAHFPGLAQVHQQKMLDIGIWDFIYIYTCLLTLRIGECPSNSPFLKNNGAEVPKRPRPFVFKEWRDTMTFSNLKSTHCTLFILLIINLVTKKCMCIVSNVQSFKLFAPCGTLKVQRIITLHSLKIMEIFDNRFTSQVDFNVLVM